MKTRRTAVAALVLTVLTGGCAGLIGANFDVNPPDGDAGGPETGTMNTGDATNNAGAQGDGGADGGDSAPDPGAGTVTALSTDRGQLTVTQGKTATLAVTITRGIDPEDVIPISVQGLPGDVTADTLIIQASATSGQLTIRAPADAPVGPAHLTITAGAAQASVSLLVQGESGTVDSTFSSSTGATGVWVSFPNPMLGIGGAGLAVQKDGKIVLCGNMSYGPSGGPDQWALARVGSDGKPDVNFGSNGKVVFPGAPGIGGVCEAVFVTDTAILFGGFEGWSNAPHTFAAGALNTDGLSFVSGFGAQGMAFSDAPGTIVNSTPPFDSKGYDMVVQPDGKLVLGGFGGQNGPALVRILPDGGPDTAFGNDGGSFLGPASPPAPFVPVANVGLTSNGSIVAMGAGASLTVNRFTPSGLPDPTFGDGGVASSGLSGILAGPRWHSIAVTPDDKVVLLETIRGGASTPDAVGLVRFDTGGIPDGRFGTNGSGSVTTPLPGYQVNAVGVAGAPDGTLIVIAQLVELQSDASATQMHYYGVIRYSADGVLDASFGGGKGFVATPMGTGQLDAPEAVAFDAYGRILVAGIAGADNLSTAAIVRYWP